MQNKLNQKIDNYGVVKQLGIFLNSLLREKAIARILLPRVETFACLLLKHITSGYFTLYQLQNKIWISEGQTQVKLIIKRCKICCN